MNINAHRKAIVRALITGMQVSNKIAFAESCDLDYDKIENAQHKQYDTCIVTGLHFPDKLSQILITYSNYGPIWMGLWLDYPFFLHDATNNPSLDKGGDFHGNTLFPRWLAEVLNEVSDMGINEKDIYDGYESE